MNDMKKVKAPPGNEELVNRLCEIDESHAFEFKRVSGKMVHKALETIVAFANTDGGYLILGIEDLKKSKGADRLYGIQENPEAVDELHEHAFDGFYFFPACFFWSISRTSRRRIFPAVLFGSSSMNTTACRTLPGASRALQWARISCASAVSPGPRTT